MSDNGFRPISERVAAVKAAITRIEHDSKFKIGNDVRYTYSSSDAVLDAVRPLLAKEGLDARPSIVDFRVDPVEVTDNYGKTKVKRYATMKAEVYFSCPGWPQGINPTASGETCEPPSTWFLEHEYSGPQTSEAMVTYIKKMFLKSRLEISTGVDIEQGTEGEQERKAAPKQQKQSPANGQAKQEAKPPSENEAFFREFKTKMQACASQMDLNRFTVYWDSAETVEAFNKLKPNWQNNLKEEWQKVTQAVGKTDPPAVPQEAEGATA